MLVVVRKEKVAAVTGIVTVFALTCGPSELGTRDETVDGEALRAGSGLLLKTELQWRLRSKGKAKFFGRGKFQDVAKGGTFYLKHYRRKVDVVDRLNAGNNEARSVNLA